MYISNTTVLSKLERSAFLAVLHIVLVTTIIVFWFAPLACAGLATANLLRPNGTGASV
jgi:hypothetical protein